MEVHLGDALVLPVDHTTSHSWSASSLFLSFATIAITACALVRWVWLPEKKRSPRALPVSSIARGADSLLNACPLLSRDDAIYLVTKCALHGAQLSPAFLSDIANDFNQNIFKTSCQITLFLLPSKLHFCVV
jgi:hypothetical protein